MGIHSPFPKVCFSLLYGGQKVNGMQMESLSTEGIRRLVSDLFRMMAIKISNPPGCQGHPAGYPV
jgi:hypothetical protein